MRVISLLVLVSAVAQAALPAYWERSREIKDIVSSPGIAAVVQDIRFKGKASGLIDSVVYGPDGGNIHYTIVSGKCTLSVILTAKPNPDPGHVGPGEYEIHWAKELTCK